MDTIESYIFISARFVYSGLGQSLGAPIYISMPITTPCPNDLHRSSSSVFFTISDRLVLICSCGSIGKEDGATWSHFRSFHRVLPQNFSSKNNITTLPRCVCVCTPLVTRGTMFLRNTSQVGKQSQDGKQRPYPILPFSPQPFDRGCHYFHFDFPSSWTH